MQRLKNKIVMFLSCRKAKFPHFSENREVVANLQDNASFFLNNFPSLVIIAAHSSLISFAIRNNCLT